MDGDLLRALQLQSAGALEQAIAQYGARFGLGVLSHLRLDRDRSGRTCLTH